MAREGELPGELLRAQPVGRYARPVSADGDRVREAVRARCAGQAGAWLDHPFGPGAHVYKVAGKMFAVLSDRERAGGHGEAASVTLKCDPEWSAVLRETHPSIAPGYHTNKRHWITVTLDGSLEGDLLDDLVDGAYDLVVATLPARARAGLPPGA